VTRRLVIVGAGAAGSVIASRASERGDQEVILLEAGPDYPSPASLPFDLADGTRNSYVAHDWGRAHRPTTGQILFPFPRGRVVGGSSAVNTCIALRSFAFDYDEWAALGLPEWSWDRCLPAFLRMERDLDFGDAPYHGAAGPLPIRRHPHAELAPLHARFLDACLDLGHPRCADHNAPAPMGVGPHPMNKLDGRRISAAEAYLTPEARAREGLRLRLRALVRRVLFRGRRAIGVELEENGVFKVLDADDVILCGGALETPALLMRSGVGPRAKLERLGVRVVSDVPAVGARLLDHPGAAIFLRPREGWKVLRDPLLQVLLRTTSEGSRFPGDIQIQSGAFFPVFRRWNVPVANIMIQVGKPRGHGTLTIDSVDPREPPRIDSCILHDDDDRARACEALHLAGRIAQTPAMRDVVTPLWPPPAALASPAAAQAVIRRVCGSGYHPCGTVPTGEATDQHGRVAGTEHLYVADASLMPTVPTTNINVPTMMIGERFGAWLRDGVL